MLEEKLLIKLLEIDLFHLILNSSKLGKICINKFHKNKIATVIKHIPGHGLSKVDSHKKLPIVNQKLNI